MTNNKQLTNMQMKIKDLTGINMNDAYEKDKAKHVANYYLNEYQTVVSL